jgi:hypothetical protein
MPSRGLDFIKEIQTSKLDLEHGTVHSVISVRNLYLKKIATTSTFVTYLIR